jgi:hypothetical protein
VEEEAVLKEKEAVVEGKEEGENLPTGMGGGG